MVYVSLNAREGEGKILAKQYRAGIYFPVFILTDSAGAPITRWQGYTGAVRFKNSLNAALQDLTTIGVRESRFEAQPTYDDAVFLAEYFSDASSYLKAVTYFRKARELSRSPDVHIYYKIFESLANAVWADSAKFAEVLPAADAVLDYRPADPRSITLVASNITRLARDMRKTAEIGKYLKAGIDITAGRRDEKSREANALFKADYALYIENDTLKALQISKASLGNGWENKPDKFYDFAKWCLERKIDLGEAEAFTRKAVNMASPGQFKAKVLNTLAEIRIARGDTADAVKIIDEAIDEDPEDDFYTRQWNRFMNIPDE